MRKAILICLAALCIKAGQVAGSSMTYHFVEGQSTVLQTGGFAGVYVTYSVTGDFELTVDFQAGVASFDRVDANVSDIGFSHTQNLNELFNMTGLVGTIVSNTEIHFVGKTEEPIPVDVNLMVVLREDSVELAGGTEPPCCDFFIYDANAVAVVASEQRIIYVDDDSTGENKGSSWTDAYKHLQDALADAYSSVKPVEIRVAEGFYTPDRISADPNGSGDRTEAFQLINDVTLKGGYAGLGQQDPDARDIELYVTILSGDLDGNDIDVDNPDDLLTEPTRAENSCNVFYHPEDLNLDDTAIIDGFTITAGNANGLSWPHNLGGGMLNDHSKPTVINCTFTANSSNNCGGGMYSFRSSPTLSNCTFSRNSALFRGCGMHNNHSSPTLTNCAFINNSGYTLGGGMYNTNDSNPRLTNCTFSWNSAYEGGGVENYSCSPTLINCTFNNNYSRTSGAGMFNYLSSNPTLTNCKFISNFAVDDGGGICNEHSSSPTLTNCMFIGNCAEWGGAFRNYGSPTLTNCIFFSNLANKDGGGFYTNSRNPTLTNCILWANSDRGGTDEFAQITRESGILVVNYSCIQGWTGAFGGIGNIGEDPLFEDSYNHDCHLKSQAGRWDPNIQGWIQDDVTSPCIDAGDPMTPIHLEPFPNGGIINMGAYGGTTEASKSYFGRPPCETIVAGDINGDCKIDFKDLAIMGRHWLEDNNPSP